MKTVLQLIAEACHDLERLREDPMFSADNPAKQSALLTRINILEYIESMYLPSGSGFDQGSTIDYDESGKNKIVIVTAFHHMDEHGFYDRWTSHSVHCIPEFSHNGFRLLIKGKDYRDIKDYILWLFHDALTTKVPESERQALVKKAREEAISITEKEMSHA